MPLISQTKIDMPMCHKLDLIIKDHTWLNKDGSIHFSCCHHQCDMDAVYSKERLKNLKINTSSKKDLKMLSISHYQTCKKLKDDLQDPSSFYSKQWKKFENNEIDLTKSERTCYDCGKSFKDKKARRRHTHERGCGYKTEGKKLGVFNFWETMPDNINMVKGLGTNEERIQLYVPFASMNKMKKNGGNDKWCVAYDYDMIEGGTTYKTRYIVSKFDGRITGIDNEQFKIYPTDFNDIQEDEEISNWELSPAELRRLKCESNDYIDGNWLFNTGIISQV